MMNSNYNSNAGTVLAVVVAIGGLLVTVAAGTGLWYCGYVVDRDCLEYLKQAANANTVEIADDRLDKALAFIDSNNWQTGNTGIFLTTPKNDVGFWVKNIRAAKAELQQIDPDASSLEKSNVLMKLRETLTDSNESGKTVVTYPENISLFPHQTVLFIGGILAILVGAISTFAGVIWIMK